MTVDGSPTQLRQVINSNTFFIVFESDIDSALCLKLSKIFFGIKFA